MPTSTPVTVSPTSTQIAIGAFNSGEYRNLFKGPLAKVFFATEITEKMSFKSFFSKVSVRSVAVSTHLCKRSKEYLDKSDAEIPSGKWRYYDGMLYMLGLLHVSGNFKIYLQG